MLAVRFDEFLRYRVGGLDHFLAGLSLDNQPGEILGSSQPSALGEFLNPNADRVLVVAFTHYSKMIVHTDKVVNDQAPAENLAPSSESDE